MATQTLEAAPQTLDALPATGSCLDGGACSWWRLGLHMRDGRLVRLARCFWCQRETWRAYTTTTFTL